MFPKYIRTVFALIVFTTVSAFAQAKPLQDVIDHYCRKNCVSAEQLTDVAVRAGKAYGIDYRAVIAIIHVESKYHIRAKNGSSVGLSQVLLRYHKPKFIGKNYYDVEDNVFAGMQVMRDCLKRTKGNYPRAFRCYNGGGDPNYQAKAQRAYAMVKSLDIKVVQKDYLGEFIKKLV